MPKPSDEEIQKNLDDQKFTLSYESNRIKLEHTSRILDNTCDCRFGWSWNYCLVLLPKFL